ncbi:MAG: dTMP kinase [Bacteroidota bacterium]|nr:dTMP kinase [Bacteroidota bacterium]MDP4232032.1 dTMP kinase [Bacteroidota bacterium]MDP4241261.1 dTMP kinase [Bacteroidota bacterium]MDP4286653.1 dTMP kinase [Bacteroidota bacterium]
MLITFEGIDGCGKSSQAQLLADRLRDSGIETLLVREPGGTDVSEHIRSILLNEKHSMPLSSTAELLLFAASRAQLVKEVIEPALAREAVVICDRFTDSTIAYQGYGRGLPLAHIRTINDVATGGLVPDLTFLIDVPIELAVHRRKGMGDDRMEAESRVFFNHVIQGYMAQAQKQPDRIHVIDGTDSMEDIHHVIYRLVEYERGNDLRHAHHIASVPATESFAFSFDVTAEALAS